MLANTPLYTRIWRLKGWHYSRPFYHEVEAYVLGCVLVSKHKHPEQTHVHDFLDCTYTGSHLTATLDRLAADLSKHGILAAFRTQHIETPGKGLTRVYLTLHWG